ncbi:heterodisulfide reductase-related iron-sulfur binding cluster [Rhodococcus sp. T2V]|uniref:(Fe-S)-binding protein n=1 Tax=Rhodococcus sp. T2V TaxID=3034164 RepID=UPI0031FEA280
MQAERNGVSALRCFLPVGPDRRPRPTLVNSLTHTPGLKTVLETAGGVDPRRPVPKFARRRFTATWRDRPPAASSGDRGRVVLWPDTFTNNFDPHIADAAVAVLEAAGFTVEVPTQTLCCGLTWISTGQLATASRVLTRTLAVLAPALRAGTPIVVLEPSCAAVFRSDLSELLHGNEDAHRLAQQTVTLGELPQQRAPDWSPPHRVDAAALIQPHCHQHAVLTYDADEQALKKAGVDTEVLDAGFCGLAGNFGFERGHYEVSLACAEDTLLPAIRAADPATLVLADGFSCRTQIRDLHPAATPLHGAQVLAAALRGDDPTDRRTGRKSLRPVVPSRTALLTAPAAVALSLLIRRRRYHH